MTLRNVLTWPDALLRETAEPVDCFDDELRSLIADMFETMYDEMGVGLAATQIGVLRRVVVLDCGGDEPDPIALVNPRLLDSEGQIAWTEGCLSIPGVRAEVERTAHVEVSYQDEYGIEKTRAASGLLSVCIQHEIDHLDGLMYFDRLGELERKAVLNAYDDYLASDSIESE